MAAMNVISSSQYYLMSMSVLTKNGSGSGTKRITEKGGFDLRHLYLFYPCFKNTSYSPVCPVLQNYMTRTITNEI